MQFWDIDNYHPVRDTRHRSAKSGSHKPGRKHIPPYLRRKTQASSIFAITSFTQLSCRIPPSSPRYRLRPGSTAAHPPIYVSITMLHMRHLRFDQLAPTAVHAAEPRVSKVACRTLCESRHAARPPVAYRAVFSVQRGPLLGQTGFLVIQVGILRLELYAGCHCYEVGSTT